MPNDHAGADPVNSGRATDNSDLPSQSIARSSSDRLHIAIAVALVAVTLVAVAFPLRRVAASAEESHASPVVAVSQGFNSALNIHAQTVAVSLAQANLLSLTREAAVSSSLEDVPGAAIVPRPLLTAAASLMVRGAIAGGDGQQSLAIELQYPVRFTLHDGEFASSVFSTRATVGAALSALGSEYSEYDIVSPSPDAPLLAGLHVFVTRADAVQLSYGGKAAQTVYTHADSVADLLAERGIKLTEGDYVSPVLSTPVRDGLSVAVTVVGTKTEIERRPIPFRTFYRDDPGLSSGVTVERQAGYDGYIELEYAVTYKNGAEVGRELISETAVAPTHRIVAQGTAVAVAAVVQAPTAPSGDPDCARSLTVWATWYTAASAGGGRTATGTIVQKGTVAVDPSVIPLGTQMYIPGYGYGRAEDTGGAIRGNMIDLGYGPADAVTWRTGYVTICILG